jgi:Zn-dependent M28 family amino/carboxypeptidase
MSEHLRALALAAKPIDPDLYGDRYFGGDYSRSDFTKEQDAFVRAATPAAILALLDELEDSHKAYALLFKENAELRKDAERYRWLRKRNTALDNIAIFTARRLTDAFGFFIQNELICDEEMDEEIDAAIDSAAKGESNAD